MAVGKHSDLVIRDERATEVFIESLRQNVAVFNEASRGAIRLVPRSEEGYYKKTKFLDRLTGGSTRRDLTSVSAATSIALTADEHITVKRFRKFGPYEQTLGSVITADMTQDEISAAVGVLMADEYVKDCISAAVISLEAALTSDANLHYDYSGTGNLAHAALITGLSKMGDQANRVVCWFGHSKPYFDLMSASLSVSSGNVGPATIFEAQVGTINRPFVMTDDANFGNNATPDKYATFGLVAGAVEITESEDAMLVTDVITGTEQLSVRFQGEYAYNVGLKGEAWDTANGGNNPTDATLGTGSNWDPVVSSYKDRAGVMIHTT